ncbi:MAG: hypothetical protein ACMXYA_03170, partial [Candidatus Woesearchaeota archaeon]
WGHNEAENGGYPFLQFQSFANVDITNPGFTQNPVITDIRTNRATLNWTADQPTNYTVRRGSTLIASSSGFVSGAQDVRFNDLNDDTEYTYNLTICTERNYCTTVTGSFTTNEETQTSGSSGSGSSNTGGGSPVAQLYTATNQELQGGVTELYRIGDRIQFDVTQSSTNTQSRHTLRVNRFNQTHADITVQSDPQRRVIVVDEDSFFDIDGDGEYDVVVRYTGIQNNQAQIRVQQYVEPEPVVEEVIPVVEEVEEEEIMPIMAETNQTIEETVDEAESRSLAWIWIVLLVLIAVAGISFFIYKRK